MATRLDQFQEFVLIFESPWNLGSLTTHKWTQSFYVTGTVNHNDADAEAAGLALASPALALAQPHTSLVGLVYYPSQSTVSTTNKTYAPGTHKGTGSAYTLIGAVQQLEVAAVAHAPVGKNSRGKTIYLRKYFHDVATFSGDPNNMTADIADPVALLSVFNTGAGPHNVVPVSPTGRGPGHWVLESHAFTHQLRKGHKKKPATTGSLIDDLVNAGLDAASAAALALKLAGKVVTK